jgi:prolyl-tRNA synthetase
MSTVARSSELYAPTLKETPADAVAASHQLLVRAGFMHQLGSGLYSLLPLGWRSVRKLQSILRQELEAIGAQEFQLPSLHPAELWRESGRWDEIDHTMFRLRDRRGGDYCLGMTHEEVFTALARAELRSYRQLPQLWYQISPKFRDELRPRGGLLRAREFLMKDAYSFDLDSVGLEHSFAKMRAAYEQIYARCEVNALPAEAFSGAMGGRESIEFVVQTEAGEDTVIRCENCTYVANLEVARSRLPHTADEPSQSSGPEVFPTPGVLTIDALTSPPYDIPAPRQLKTLVYAADSHLVVAVLRGDHTLHEAKLLSATGASHLRPAEAEEIFTVMGAHPGSLGAVGFTRAPVFVDAALTGRTNMVTGANQDGVHLRGVDVFRDVLQGSHALSVDLRSVAAGETCPNCEGLLQSLSALEVGHIFKLGTRYSARLGATVLDAAGAEVPLVMGSYGIGVGRLLAAIVEQHHDADGIVWPRAVAPYTATVLQLGNSSELEHLASEVILQLTSAGLDVLYDDRHERAGVKFKDADLIGIPLRITVGKRGLADQTVEWKARGEQMVKNVRLSEINVRLDHEFSTGERRSVGA